MTIINILTIIFILFAYIVMQCATFYMYIGNEKKFRKYLPAFATMWSIIGMWAGIAICLYFH